MCAYTRATLTRLSTNTYRLCWLWSMRHTNRIYCGFRCDISWLIFHQTGSLLHLWTFIHMKHHSGIDLRMIHRKCNRPNTQHILTHTYKHTHGSSWFCFVGVSIVDVFVDVDVCCFALVHIRCVWLWMWKIEIVTSIKQWFKTKEVPADNMSLKWIPYIYHYIYVWCM